MSEAVEGAVVTAGGLLREARQAAGLHIAALAVALKVPVSKLEALEADDYAKLTDTVFVRALASSVCRTLKADPGPILALLPQSQSPRLSTDSAGLNAPVKTNAGKLSSSSGSFSSGGLSRSVVGVVLVLLVGALAVFFFPRPSADSGDAIEPMTSPATNVTEPVSATPPAPVLAPSEAPANPAPAVSEAAVVAPVAGATQASAPLAAASAVAAAATAADIPSGTLVLRARSQSWVQVRDATGKVVLERNLAADESASVNVPGPLTVVIGRADATEVFVRGKPFDLAGVSRENVARFEVK